MLIEQALMTFLLAQTGITGYVGRRIYFNQAKQATAKPYLVIKKISGPREHSHDGSCGLAHPRFQFSCFAKEYGDAKNAIAAIQTALDGYSGTMGGDSGVTVGAAFYDDENDFYEEDTGLHHVAADYIIWHKES